MPAISAALTPPVYAAAAASSNLVTKTASIDMDRMARTFATVCGGESGQHSARNSARGNDTRTVWNLFETSSRRFLFLASYLLSTPA